jgi:hypothetical protein
LGFDCVTTFELELEDDDLWDFETPTPTPTPTAINPTNATMEPITCMKPGSAGNFPTSFSLPHSQSTLSASWRLVVSPTSDYPETHHIHRNLVRMAP